MSGWSVTQQKLAGTSAKRKPYFLPINCPAVVEVSLIDSHYELNEILNAESLK